MSSKKLSQNPLPLGEGRVRAVQNREIVREYRNQTPSPQPSPKGRESFETVSKPLSRDQIIEALRVECDNYAESVLAVKAMANVLRWDQDARKFDDDSAMGIGPRLQTSSANRISPDTIVTPDLAVTRHRQGYVVEAKVAMSPLPERREERLLQLQKYDDQLTGWSTDTLTVDAHDILLLVHHTRAFDVIEQLSALREANRFRIDRPFSVLGFVISEQRHTYLALELKDGALSDAKLTFRLRRVVSVELVSCS